MITFDNAIGRIAPNPSRSVRITDLGKFKEELIRAEAETAEDHNLELEIARLETPILQAAGRRITRGKGIKKQKWWTEDLQAKQKYIEELEGYSKLR